jgi:uncharacterized protein
MATTYRRPGVYLEEGTLTGPGEIGLATAVGMFVGAASQGPTENATLITSWSEYESVYGGWKPPVGTAENYLPYAVWGFFQNGGRNAWVQRAAADDEGDTASANILGTGDAIAFIVNAISPGVWAGGDIDGVFAPGLSVAVDHVQTGGTVVYTFYVYKDQGGGYVTEVERFQNISLDGKVPGTKRVDHAVNDEVYGSRYVRIASLDQTVEPQDSFEDAIDLVGGADGGVPSAANLNDATRDALGTVEGPIILNVAGYRDASSGDFISTTFDPSGLDRGDVFLINDYYDKRASGISSEAYGAAIIGDASPGSIKSYAGSSYVASYTPWIVVPDPAVNGGTLVVPPGGSVAGMMARNDATNGVYQAPAGVQFGGLNNALGVDAKFSDPTLGTLNSMNINVIRPVVGAGISVMGGRTRKNFAVDKYVSARRTLIFIKETMKRSCEFALFKNNDENLWAALRATAELVLRPVWAQNGLKGRNPNEAYRIVCDASINTPAVVASGEVRMEIAVALQSPAEFIVIRVSQMAGGTAVTEI